MNRQYWTLVGMFAVVAGVSMWTGCAGTVRHGGAPRALHAASDAYVGTYTGPSGQTVSVSRNGDGFTLNVTRDGQTRPYDGYVLNIDGVSVWEITLANPTSDTDSEGRPVVPTFMYGRTERRGDDVVFRRLRAEWLQQQAKGVPDSAFGMTPQIAEGSGAIVVRHPAAVESILRKAVHDPAAFGDAEVFAKAR